MVKKIILSLLGVVMLFGLFGCRKKVDTGWTIKGSKAQPTAVEELVSAGLIYVPAE